MQSLLTAAVSNCLPLTAHTVLHLVWAKSNLDLQSGTVTYSGVPGHFSWWDIAPFWVLDLQTQEQNTQCPLHTCGRWGQSVGCYVQAVRDLDRKLSQTVSGSEQSLRRTSTETGLCSASWTQTHIQCYTHTHRTRTLFYKWSSETFGELTLTDSKIHDLFPCGLTWVLQQCDFLGTLGAQQNLSGCRPAHCWARGGGARKDVTKHWRRLHHVIPLEHGHAGETLVHDVGRVLRERQRGVNACDTQQDLLAKQVFRRMVVWQNFAWSPESLWPTPSQVKMKLTPWQQIVSAVAVRPKCLGHIASVLNQRFVFEVKEIVWFGSSTVQKVTSRVCV